MNLPPGRMDRATGIVLGIVLAALAASGFRQRGAEAHRDQQLGWLLSDCGGALQTVVIHYVPETAIALAPIYGDFLRQLVPNVRVLVVSPAADAAKRLADSAGIAPNRLVAVPVDHPMTSWSRDRWLAVAPGQSGMAGACLLTPWEETGEEVWPERRGDGRIAFDLAQHGMPDVRVRRSPLRFDGGDFAADDETVFITAAVADANAGLDGWAGPALPRRMQRLLGRRAVVFDDCPPHHAGMFLMPVGDGRVFVGDPALARQFDTAPGRETAFPERDTSPETQRQFDAVARRCEAEGYTVLRMPVVPATDGRTYWTYLNVIIDRRDGKSVVYMPVYRGAENLNREAARRWEAAGFSVRPVDCTPAFRHGGSLRCLVNVLAREPA